MHIKKKLIRLTEDYKITNQVKFIDHCNNMPLAYQISDMIISASIEPEAFGRVSVEAQSMKKIIIASDIGGSNETIINNKTGLLFQSAMLNLYVKRLFKVLQWTIHH